MHRPSKYAEIFFDAGECRIYLLTFPFDKLPFINPFSVWCQQRFIALLSASLHVLFIKKNKSALTCIWTLISKYFTHGLRELSLLTQKVNIPHMHFSPTFVKFKKGVYFAHLVFWGPENFWERNKTLWFPCQLSPLNFSSNFQKTTTTPCQVFSFKLVFCQNIF